MRLFGATLGPFVVTRPFGLYEPIDDPGTVDDALVSEARLVVALAVAWLQRRA